MKILLWMAVFLLGNLLNAQNFTLKGTIKDERGDPIPFANIMNGKSGTRSDENGQFKLTIATLPIKITIGCVGYETVVYQVKKSNYKNLKIILKTVVETTEEVVVTGYTAHKNSSELTISSSSSRKFYEKGKSVKSIFHKEIALNHSGNSNLLTAAELNDFTKWTLWNDYNKEELNEFVKQYQISYTNRYSIQLINDKSQPIINKKVSLKSLKNDSIVWTSITDNTGKAELWNTTSHNFKNKELALMIDVSQYSVHSFEEGVNFIKIQAPCNVNNKVDIAFIVDATGSMQDEINYLKAELQDIIEKVSSAHKSTMLRFSSLFYRDYSEAYVTTHLPFTNNVKELTNYIALQNASGGGDYPEAVVAALKTGIDSLQWDATAKTRIAFLILDAPPHYNEINDFNKLIKQYAQKGIRVVPIVCSGAGKSVEFLMRNTALATNGVYAFLTDDSGIGDKHMKPTTDEFKVLLLNELMIQIINRMIYTTKCDITIKELNIENPFSDIIKKSNEVKIFPNPTKGYCILESEEPIQTIYIADFTGKILQRWTNLNKKNGNYEFDLSKYAAGTYLLRYETEEGKKGTAKIIKL